VKTAIGSAIVCAVSACLAACGGGGGDPAPTPSGPSEAQRTMAATSTAQSTTNPCATIGPFYWEIGDRNARIASGSVAVVGNATTYASNTVMSIASASKWLYGAYVAQKKNGVLSDSDIKFLNFRSGYTNFSACQPGQSVDDCVAYASNGVHSAATDGYFFYDGGHMENHASQAMGLGPLQNAALASEIRSQLGADIALAYSQPQLAGGVVTTADDYARFLRKLLGGQLQMAALLGSHPVCTNPTTCSQALATPIPTTLSWHYSIGHWVEDDPATGDGSFSSAGAFGFYPWVDASKAWYGIVARSAAPGSGYDSAMCGAAIRKAWVTGEAQ
jgi:hypothetical protein